MAADIDTTLSKKWGEIAGMSCVVQEPFEYLILF
jgi:hypothetical protein